MLTKGFLRSGLVLLVLTVLLPFSAPARADERGPGSPKPPPPPGTESSASQLKVTDLTGPLTPDGLAHLLAGPGVTVSNVSYRGAQVAAGSFSGGEASIGFPAGVLLSTGRASNVVGPNQVDDVSTVNGTPGDSSLSALSGFSTYDAAVLEFDFVPVGDHVSFQFVFASEEYNEYVNSKYNDVFAFFVNGANCASVEGVPVSINTINNGNPVPSEPRSRPELYVNNERRGGAGLDTEMDGLTSVLTCASPVRPNQSNRLKLAIADGSDRIYDSAVFIKAGSVTTGRRPLILLPGMTASANWSCFLLNAGCQDEARWGWMVTAESYYQPLIERLNGAGYSQENGYLSVFYYDWRRPLQANASQLQSRIEAVKARTGAAEVDLVGHSMGGLLGRAYVQSGAYGGDVAHLVTLGSPHAGSAKAYPYWEAAHFYQMNSLEKIGLSTIMAYYMAREANPIPVYVIRKVIPSFKDILPTGDYLYENGSNTMRTESGMLHRNGYLVGLNEDLDSLFTRTKVASFAGQGLSTTERFFVSNRFFWEWPNWDDGKPNWARTAEFMALDGDGTVTVKSASLPAAAHLELFPQVTHARLPADNAVINAVFSYLQISAAQPAGEPGADEALVLFLDGPATATVKDPRGRVVTSALAPKPLDSPEVEAIPQADYVEFDGQPFQLIFIPAPIQGRYEISLRGNAAGVYRLGLLDTFGQDELEVTDLEAIWEISRSQIEPNLTARYAFDYSPEASTLPTLLGLTPVIELPLWAGDPLVAGRALPGELVEIRAAHSGAVMGSGTAGSDGRFAVTLKTASQMDQQVYPLAKGKTGLGVTAQPRTAYLPLIKR